MVALSVVRTRVGIVLALLLLSLLVFGLAGVRSDATAEERFGRRRQMLGLTNEDRIRHDRVRLDFASRISRYAKRHSEAMARKGNLFHSTEDQLRRALERSEWSLAGENVGVGNSLESLEDAFMASKLHRQNILRPSFRDAAVGIVREHGRLWVTVIFYG
jgi:uncharacterized protein YkwD